MTAMTASVRAALSRARVAHFATSAGDEPAVVPICFVLRAQTLYHAIDRKPKSRPAQQLQRVRNVRRNPRAAAIIDHYAEDWRRLWFAVLHGRVRVLQRGAEHRRVLAALRRKYPQYRELPLDPTALVLALDIRRVSVWRAAPSPRRPL